MYAVRNENPDYIAMSYCVETSIDGVYLDPESNEIILFGVDGCIVIKVSAKQRFLQENFNNRAIRVL